MHTNFILSSGHMVRIDLADHDAVSRHSWSVNLSRGKVYAVSRINGRRRTLHAFLMGTVAGMEIDHINGNGLDNRRWNLRWASHQQNTMNRKLAKNNASGHTGIHRCSQTGMWHAQIKFNGRTRHIGRYQRLADAVDARRATAALLFGSFAPPTHCQ